ncbi:MAG: hypothetical protein HQL52_12595 [Magnetococcales bacterium]|nr:hypothetical protein [Magnetococcales bacterium]
MDELTIARGIHLIGVVLWIGGVAMVTTVLLPVVSRFKSPQERVPFFEQVEKRFAWQARLTTLITGLSGFYMMFRMELWSLLGETGYWWMTAMIAIWFVFTLMLFVLEPLFLHDWFLEQAAKNPEKTFRRIQTMHWVLLTLSLLTVLGAAAGSHGGLLFQ